MDYLLAQIGLERIQKHRCTSTCRDNKRNLRVVLDDRNLVKHILGYVQDPYDLIYIRSTNKTFNDIISTEILPIYGRSVLSMRVPEDFILSTLIIYLKTKPLTLDNFDMYLTFEVNGRPQHGWEMNIPKELKSSKLNYFRVNGGEQKIECIEKSVREGGTWPKAFFNVTMKKYRNYKFARIPLEIWELSNAPAWTLHSMRTDTLYRNEYMIKVVPHPANGVQFFVHTGQEFHSDHVLQGTQYVSFFQNIVFQQ